MTVRKFVVDTDVKSAILTKIAAEVAKFGAIGGINALDSYYKDPNGGGGGVYGKGDNPVFGKSDPPKHVEMQIDLKSKVSMTQSITQLDALSRKARIG